MRIYTQWQRIPLEPFLEALGDEDEYIREDVVEILSTMQERLPLETLLNVLRGKNNNARQAALQVLGATKQDIPSELVLQVGKDRPLQRLYHPWGPSGGLANRS